MIKEPFFSTYLKGPFCFVKHGFYEVGKVVSVPSELDCTAADDIFLDTNVSGWDTYKNCMKSDELSKLCVARKDLVEVNKDLFVKYFLDEFKDMKAALSECVQADPGAAQLQVVLG